MAQVKRVAFDEFLFLPRLEYIITVLSHQGEKRCKEQESERKITSENLKLSSSKRSYHLIIFLGREDFLTS